MHIVRHKIRRSEEVKEKARELRKSGKTYPEIISELKVPKSTLHLWIRDLGVSQQFSGESRKLWWAEMQKLAVKANKQKYSNIYSKLSQKAQAEVNELNLEKSFYKPLLSCLYWAEGAKSKHNCLMFANTDPKLTLLFITLLRKSYPIDESKFRIRIHLHHYHNEEKVKNFWSELLQVPLSQFGKTYYKQRSKEKTFRQNFGGICFVVYNSVYLKEEIVQHGLAIGEKITGKVVIPEISSNWT